MRTHTITQEVATPFRTMFIHLEVNNLGQPVGGSISHKGKEPESQITLLVECLSKGLNRAMEDCS